LTQVENNLIPETKYKTLTFKHFSQTDKNFTNFRFFIENGPLQITSKSKFEDFGKRSLKAFPNLILNFSDSMERN
jgi:hypothetical protein